jgi:hypothetical protein
MRVDTNFFCTVPMPDAGDPAVAATSRRYGNDDVIACYENLVAWAKTADEVGIDTMWLTEHHFQYEGYEVLPNLIMFGLHLAHLTNDLRLGQMFNVVPQWHPLRLAEDFALADIVTGGRMEFGVGRGTVPREAWALGTVVASGDNAMSAEHDRINRETFEEAMEVIKLAWYNERFSYRGKHFTFPSDDIPDRGSMVNDLTLIPKPRRVVDVYQPVTSPEQYKPSTWNDATMGIWHPVVDGLLVAVDGAYSKCRQIPVDYVNWSQLRAATPADAPEPYEVAVRVAARTKTREEAVKVGREVDGMAVSGIAHTGKRVPHADRTREVIGVWSSLVPREQVPASVVYFES